MMLTPAVEDFLQSSSYTAAYPIRQYFYGLLIGDKMCTEYDRNHKIDVQALLPKVSSDEQKKLQLKRLHKAPEGLRHRVFEEALQVQTSALENIPDQLKLPVCVTVFWFNILKLEAEKKAETVLHALLLWFVCDPNSPEDEFERKMKTLKDEGVSNWQPQPHVAKAFIQWLCCMRQSLHLNQLLCSPLPEPQCARLYCGPLLHRLADEDTIEEVQKTLRGEKKELYENLKTACNPSSGEGSSQSSRVEVPSTEKESSSGEWQTKKKKQKGGGGANRRKRSDY
ncbi:protein asteroid homolog 1-like isoform X2 [Simochromis diagramma]|uniref:protein asteroid homolog 1-like isoform X2 n=1 Tax=Simochromis diagramma TaxID=43689 RepID=UPI001A7E5FF5|nr:protein asteroid homolog 1-like isoform X2 [Simochromis diagramma]